MSPLDEGRSETPDDAGTTRPGDLEATAGVGADPALSPVAAPGFAPDPKRFAADASFGGFRLDPVEAAAGGPPEPDPKPRTGPAAAAPPVEPEPPAAAPTPEPEPPAAPKVDPQALLDESVGHGAWAATVAAAEAPLRRESAWSPDSVRVRAPAVEFGGGDIGAGGDRLAAVVAYLLLIAGVPTLGLGLLAALAIAWARKDEEEPWLRTHYVLQFRTAWMSILAGVASVFGLFVPWVGGLGVAVLVSLGGWIVLRSALGLDHLFHGRAHPKPLTLTI